MSILPSQRNNKPGLNRKSAWRPFILLTTLAALSIVFTGCSHIGGAGHHDKDEGFSLVVDQDAVLQFDRSGAVDSPREIQLQPILEQVQALFKGYNEETVAVVVVSRGSAYVDICWFNEGEGTHECIRIPLR